MPENIANGKEGCNSADDREKLSKGSLRNSPPEGRVFTYVDKPATYVLLKGSYYAKDTDGKETTVKYYEYDTNFYAAVVEDKVYLVNKMNVKDLDEAYQKVVNPDTEDAEESTSDTATEEN